RWATSPGRSRAGGPRSRSRRRRFPGETLCGSCLQLPSFAVLALEQPVGLRRVDALQVRGIPFELLAETVGDGRQVVRLGEQAGVAERARGLEVGLRGLDPLLVVADRLRDPRLRPLEL